MTFDFKEGSVDYRIREVFIEFPDRFYTAQDFAEGDVGPIEECHKVCEQLWLNDFVGKTSRCHKNCPDDCNYNDHDPITIESYSHDFYMRNKNTTARERDRERDKEKTVESQHALWLRNYSELVNTTEAQEKLREIADYLEDLLE